MPSGPEHGYERKRSPMKAAYQLLREVVSDMAGCRDDSWVRISVPCERIPENTNR